MASASLREAMMARCRCGMRPMAGMSTPIAGTLVVSMQWPGHRMASASPRGAMMTRCRCGMQPMAGMSTPTAGMLTLCGGWPGHRMASASFLEAGISILEEAIQPRRCGMQPMAGMSSSIAGMPAPCGRWPGPRMASASPRGAQIRPCRYGERCDGKCWLHSAKGNRMMRMVSRRGCWPFSFLLVFILLSLCSPPKVRADGGAPNLAYVSGTPSGVSVIDLLQGKVTKLISVAGDPHTILLSLDGRFLYVTQPGLGQVTVILAETGQPVCIARLPGKPAFLALDQYSNILYVAGSGAARVTALDPTTCAVQHVFQVESPVYGLAVAVVATGSSVNHQLWVAGMDALTIFDGLTE